MMIHVRNRAGKCFNVPYNNICFKCDVKGEVCNIRAGSFAKQNCKKSEKNQ